MRPVICVLVAIELVTGVAYAQPLDPGAARAQLKEGFNLMKNGGHYAEALPHLRESLRLDPPQVKTLLNLADCEEHLGKLVDADTHWVAARDQAAADANQPVREEAQRRLDALEARMPKLTITLAADAPPDSEVMRDGVTLSAVSLGTPLPDDPGKHVVVVRSKGRAEGTFEVELVEGDKKELMVSPGPPAANPVAVTTEARSTDETLAPLTKPVHRGGALRTVGLVTGVAGLAGLVVGGIFGGVAIANKSAADAQGCSDNACPPAAASTRDTARLDANVSTGMFITGGVLTALGITLFLVAPRSHIVQVGTSGLGLFVKASF